MKILGFLTFVVGIIVTISAGAKLPSPPDFPSHDVVASWIDRVVPGADVSSQFPDTLADFVKGVVLSVIGLTMWWKVVLKERHASRSASGSDASAVTNPVTILQQLQDNLTSTLGELDSLVKSDLQARISAVIDSHVTPLAEARHRIIDRFGMSKGADILVATAYGERMLNRVWSAAADGYIDEARSSFREAATAFDEAAAKMTPLPADA